MTRVMRTWVSLRICFSVPAPAANEARTASIWLIDSCRPSSTPIATTCSSCSALANVDVTVSRDPVGVSSKANSARMTGMDSTGLPSRSAKPSVTTNWRGASTLSHTQYPPCWSPSGPVMV